MTHQTILLENNTPMDDEVTKMVIAGLMDKRAKIKVGWATASSSIIWNAKSTNPSLVAFSKNISKNLFGVFNEVAANGVQASQNRTILAGYAICAATLGRWSEWPDSQLCTVPSENCLTTAQLVKSEGVLKSATAVAPKPSFLLNERIYSKLSVERDQLWAINALEVVGTTDLEHMGLGWSIAAIYFVVNPGLSWKVRSTAMVMVEKVLLSLEVEKRCEGADYVVLGMEDWLRQVLLIKYSI